jgi:NADPH-dependent 2,4-dienoyl-CoA reductase/sulfur reductase-like enzyme
VPQFDHLIVGGGMTAAAAVNGIREVDPYATIGVIGAESHRPYNRPPLSKGLWKGDAPDSIWRELPERGVTVLLGRRVTHIDPGAKSVSDDSGDVHQYRKLLLATGGTPRRLPRGAPNVIYYRTYDDYERLRGLANQQLRFAVLGGGFIGSEIAAALRMQDREVVMLIPEEGPGARVFPADLTRFVGDYYREKGVELHTGQGVTALETRGTRTVATMTSGATIEADAVVAGLGIEPDVGIARDAGLAIEHGIVVDDQLLTSHPDIYAAGDVASFHNPALVTRIRVEHEDNANTMGRHAGRNMAGEAAPYHHLPFFYSDLFELGYEAVGDVRSSLETVSDWKEPFREGVVYYLAGGRVRGVLLWNVWGQVDAARQLIAEPGPFTAQSLKGRLPA